MRTIAITENAEVEIISAYTAANQNVPAVAVAPGWTSIGTFNMPAGAIVKIELIGLVSDPGNVMNARLYDLTPGDPKVVSGSLTPDLTDTTLKKILSGAVQLPGSRLYQFQVQVIGIGYGFVSSASLTS